MLVCNYIVLDVFCTHRVHTLYVLVCDHIVPPLSEIGISFMTGNISVEEDVGTVQVRLMANGKYETPFVVGVTCFEKFPVEAEGTRM